MPFHRLAPLTLCALAVTGCSIQQPDAPKRAETTPARDTPRPRPDEKKIEPRLLTPAEVDRYAERSPRRAVMDFWFAIQYRDLLTAYNLLTPSFRERSAKNLERFGEFVMADYGRWTVKPEMLFTRVNDRRATVGVRYVSQGGVPEVTSFSLVRTGGSWLIAYEFYLANRLAGA